MSDPSIRGRFVWHELLTTDPKSAAAFFSRLTGWKTAPWPGAPSYTVCSAGNRQVAGIMALPEEAKQMGAASNWVTHIATPKVDETVALATSLGAKVLKAATDIPTVGRFAVLQDPQGAVFSVYTPITPTKDTPAGLGEFSWHELATTDWRAALTFYQRLFGWEETGSMDMGPSGTYQMFGRNGQPLGGIFNKFAHMSGPAFWLPYIRIADAKAAAETVKALGAQVINGPMEVPGGDWIAQGLDLQGAMFAVHSVTASAGAGPTAGKSSVRKRTVRKAAAKRPAAKKAAAARPLAKKGPAKKRAAKKRPTKGGAAKKRAPKRSIRKGAAKASTRGVAKRVVTKGPARRKRR